MTTPQTPDQPVVDEFVGNAHGNFARVRELLQEYPGVLNASATWHETAIEAAAQMGRADIARYLLDAGAPLDICTAAMLGQRDNVRALLEADPAQARATGAHGIALLYFPAIMGDVATAELLLAHGADANAGVAGAATPLHGAALFNQPALAEWLLDHGVQPSPADYEGKTPLAIAREREHAEVAAVLERYGATA
jgi:ankyrin repeat protein